ncbi:lysophosphatidate acyltransferase [Babesia microti strain RI]|uniref:Lysophosphatidate acyltransferase n=1 Tax=Babesia microti (strain RI) TaxID=1133968 RepID=A0A1R4ABJ4_BABMR|nr:lysophosphatidate acyltransferase [Babesia microti strain RI]SJK86393.1 lysophosphatidate acyltransferase [Babesia microti strain RI]|eukprot:XP_021338554.1 lysophosphatidate acyltransferase [Babesia microti strain RI]
MRVRQILASLHFYLGCFIGCILVPILSLINVVLLFPFYIYNPSYFYKAQLSIVVFGYVYIPVLFNPYITCKMESDENTFRGPAIYIFNHISNADPFIISCLLRFQYGFVYKDSLHKIPFCNITLPLSGNVPVRFHYIDGKKIPIKENLTELFDTCKRRLDTGISLIIFPEGTRSRDGKLKAFKHGFFRLALEHGYPIVPCAIHGTEKIFPRYSNILNPGHAYVRMGKPIWPSDIPGLNCKAGCGTSEAERTQVDAESVEKLANLMQLEVYKLIRKFSSFTNDQLVQELEEKLKAN